MPKTLLAAGILLAAALGCGKAGSPTAVPNPTATRVPTTPRVVILSIDGLRPDALMSNESLRAGAPHILGLAARGAYTWRAQTVSPSETLPGHASMLSGQPPSVHRQTWDDYEPWRGYITVPTVFTIARAAGLRTAMVVGKDKLQHLKVPGSVDGFGMTNRGDADIANEAIVQVQAGFDLMFVHFPDVDLGGHEYGWLSTGYSERVCAVDRAIGRLLSALPPGTTIILSADHGGRGTNHAARMSENLTIPWIIAGPRVVARGELARPVRTTDTAATALYVLGLALPPEAEGRPVTEIFAPAP
jgi:predicted AlkP superfamily pyrophosphatase or phosphodiesterase